MKKWLSLLILLVAVVYRDSFLASFFQDDKLLLEKANFQHFFSPVPDFHYHLISNQLFYFISKTIFGLNPLEFHLIEFLFFASTIFLIFKLANYFLVDKTKALATTFFYALNISLFANFYWIAVSYFVFGSFFFFLTVYKHFKSSKFTFLFFILGLLSNELVFVLPFLLFFIKRSKNLILLFLIDFIFIFFKIFWVGFPTVADYKLQFNFGVLATIRWYLLRAFNLPEGVRFSGNPLIFILFGLFILILFFGNKPKPKIFWLSVIWFFIGAAPFYFLPEHMSAYYLSIALFGPALFFGERLIEKKLFLAAAIYFLLTIVGLDFLRHTHWIILKNTGPIGKF